MTTFSNSQSVSAGSTPPKHASLHSTEFMKQAEQAAYEEIDSSRRVRETRLRSQAKSQDQISAAQRGQTASSDETVVKSKKPKLPAPKGKSSKSHWDSGESGPSIVMILGEVLSLVAKSSSINWSMQRSQGLSSMNSAFSLAKVTGDATIAAAQAKSDATSTQADQYKADAWIGLGTAGLTALMGAAPEISKISSESAATDDVAASLTKNAPAPETIPTESTALDETEQANQAKKVEGDTDLARKGQSLKDSVAKKLGYFAKVSDAVIKTHQFIGAVSQAGQHFMDAGYQNTIAQKQLAEGQSEALAQESQQYSQYHNDAFSLATSGEQTAQQMVDKAAQTLESMSGTITQVVMGMYRG